VDGRAHGSGESGVLSPLLCVRLADRDTTLKWFRTARTRR